MPNPRFVLDPDKLVLSKAGKNALNSSLPDADKIFDSRWLFGSGIIYKGFHEFVRPASPPRGPYVINFPAQTFVPAVHLMWFVPKGTYTSQEVSSYPVGTVMPADLMVFMGNPAGWTATVTTNQISITDNGGMPAYYKNSGMFPPAYIGFLCIVYALWE